MKLASYASETHPRDGQLMVVSSDLRWAHPAPAPYQTLQHALDDWAHARPLLQDMALQLQAGQLRHSQAFQPFDARQCLAPLPRAYQWADGSAYVNHVQLVRQARGAEMPASFWTDPLIYQGGSDDLQAAQAPIQIADAAWGADFEAEVAIITDDVPAGISVAQAAQHIQLILLVNDVSLRHLIPAELAKGFGFFQSKPATACSPVVVTPDELGAAWQDNKIHLPLDVYWNGQQVGSANAGVDMVFDFAQLIAHAAKTRRLIAGSIIGSGTVSNQNPAAGFSCIAEQRAREMIATGEAVTPYLQSGDRVQIEMLDAEGQSIFGSIDQQVEIGVL